MANSFADMRKRSSESTRYRARLRTGGKVHSDAAEDKKLVDREFKRLEANEVEKKNGGPVSGAAARPRLDHFKRGGRVKTKGHGRPSHTKVNVIIAPQGGGAAPGAGAAGPPMPPHPPMPMPPPKPPMAGPGGAPGGPMPPPGMAGPGGPMPPHPPMAADGGRVPVYKRGGKVGSPAGVSKGMPGGAGGAAARLKKRSAYGA